MQTISYLPSVLFFFLFWTGIFPGHISAQDFRVFKGAHFQGESVNMVIGDEIIIDPPLKSISFIKFNPAAALLVEALGPVPNDVENWTGTYQQMFYYSDEWKRSEIGGTAQYGKIPVRVKCIKKMLPEPVIYIPADFANIHPESSPFPYPVADKTMLYLKRAFFWENSEDLLCNFDLNPFTVSPHGPTGDIKINVCDTSASKYSLDSLNKFQQLWDISKESGCYVHVINNPTMPLKILSDCDSRLIDFHIFDFLSYYAFDYTHYFDTTIYLSRTNLHANTIFGPAYVSPPACDAPDLNLELAHGPVAHNEWIDSPWGMYYSNIAVIDWDSISADEVTLVVSEADRPVPLISDNLSDVMGTARVKRSDTADVLINVGMFGWIIVKNEKSNHTSVENVRHYWYPTWNGESPELTIGPPGPIKHFEPDNYFCEEVGEKCAPVYNTLIENAQIKAIYINLSERDTFRTYWHSTSAVNTIVTDTFYSNTVHMDSLIWIKSKYISQTLYDTFLITPDRLYRRWGSQYQPYYAYSQIERYVLDNSEIGVYGGIVPANNYIEKEITLLPLDEQLGHDKRVLNEYADAAATQKPSDRNDYKKAKQPPRYRLFPNPAGDYVFVGISDRKCRITIFDGLGKLALRIPDQEFTGIGEHVYGFSIAGLTPGFYFVRFEGDNSQVTNMIFMKQ